VKNQGKGINRCPARAELEESLHRGTRILLNHSKAFANLKQKSIAERKISLALLKLGAVIRRKWKESLNDGSRVDLRELLEDAKSLAIRMAKILSDDRLAKALKLLPVKEEFMPFFKFENNRPGVIKQMQDLASVIPSVQDYLKLSGGGGRSGPFHTVQLPAKVLLSVYGVKIFTELLITKQKQPPGARNTKLIDFLDCIWCLAIGASESEKDWSTPIKTARIQRETGTGLTAHMLARREADDFVRDLLRDVENGRRGALLAQNFLS
jgi:hypothetical protein